MHIFNALYKMSKIYVLAVCSVLVFILFLSQLLPTYARDASGCNLVDRLPATLKKSGCYRLTEDFNFEKNDGAAIHIVANDIDLDFAGHSLTGSGSHADRAIGLMAEGVRNVIVRNGRLENFFYGIRFDYGDESRKTNAVTVSGMALSGNTFRGISTEGDAVQIIGNTIDNTGGTSVYPDAFAMALEVKGNNCSIRNNKINEVIPIGIGEGVGISLTNERDGCVIEDNDIRNTPDGKGTFGIWLSNVSGQTLVKGNTIEGYVLPFSLPLEDYEVQAGLDISGNTVGSAACSPQNYGNFYKPILPSNFFKASNLECPLLANVQQKNLLASPDDARTVFRYAVSLYHCEADPWPDTETCCRMQREALSYYRKAVELGLPEAKRVYPAVSKYVLETNLKCNPPREGEH